MLAKNDDQLSELIKNAVKQDYEEFGEPVESLSVKYQTPVSDINKWVKLGQWKQLDKRKSVPVEELHEQFKDSKIAMERRTNHYKGKNKAKADAKAVTQAVKDATNPPKSTTPIIPTVPADIYNGLEGLTKLDRLLQDQAISIIDRGNNILINGEDLSPKELEQLASVNCKIREAYFKDKNTTVNILNNISNERVDYFKELLTSNLEDDLG